MPPVFGMLSDNTRGSWGRRRPYIAAKALLLVLSALLLAVAGNITLFVIALFIGQVGSNAANASYQIASQESRVARPQGIWGS